MEQLHGIEAIKVVSAGVAPAGDQPLGYVELEFADGQKGAIFFSGEVADTICLSFIKAASRLCEDRMIGLNS